MPLMNIALLIVIAPFWPYFTISVLKAQEKTVDVYRIDKNCYNQIKQYGP